MQLKRTKKKESYQRTFEASIIFLQKKNYSLREIRDVLDISLGTVIDWLRRMHKMGPEDYYTSWCRMQTKLYAVS